MISQLSALPQGQPQPLDTLSFPLYGVRLIEASAGTGKTYTLAGLYLRLLLGHGLADAQGMPTAHVRPLAVTEILVVTFTEAATAELRGRIRSRIHEARLAFLRSQLPPGKQDPFLAQLLLDLTDHATAARLLLGKPQRLDGINGRHGPGMASRHLLIPQCRQYLQLLLAQPGRKGIEQSLGAGPELMHRLHHSAIQRVELAAPVVTHRLQPELGFIGEQFGFKQGTRFKGILPQHTLTEAVKIGRASCRERV